MSGLSNLNLFNIMGIVADVLLVFILLIALIVGIKKGFVKMSKGLIASILVLVVAVFATSPLTTVITANTQWDEQLANAIQPGIESRLDEPNTVVTYYDFGHEDGKELAFIDKDGEYQQYDKIFEGNLLFSSLNLQNYLKPVFESALESEESVYMIKAITASIATLIILVATFIVVLIVARILVSILFALLKKVASSLYVLHFVDKFLGAIFGVALGVVVMLVLLTVFQLLEDFTFMSPVNEVISRSYITNFFVKHNYLYTLLIRFVDLKSLLAKIKI
ncbi:MAG: CvpA family protein [Clostridia bacterium]